MLFQLMYSRMSQSYNPNIAETILVWALPRSLATTSGIIIIFSSCGYLDVSVPRVRLSLGEISCLQHDGLPHSEIAGSKVVCTYPTLIAAYHVLHRLFEPRHPPSALLLSSFFIFTTRCALRTPFLICFLSTNTSKISFTTCVINRGE